jgi:hypothetical protein
MLEACPAGSNFCRVRGGSFCTTHEADDPHVVRALASGQQVYEVGTGRPLRNLAEPATGNCEHGQWARLCRLCKNLEADA